VSFEKKIIMTTSVIRPRFYKHNTRLARSIMTKAN